VTFRLVANCRMSLKDVGYMHKVYGLYSGNYLFLSVIWCAFVMKNGNTRQLLVEVPRM
jgi:drug/metabolite transporter superfamily protein YnfA